MALKDIGNNLVSSISGNVNKAYIMITKPKPKAAAAGNGAVGAVLGKVQQASGIARSAALLQGAAASALSAGGAAAGSSAVSSKFGGPAALLSMPGASDFIPLQVQYNPSSVSLQSEAGEVFRESAGAGSESRYEQTNTPEETVLRMDLIFDDMNIKDAFMWDNLRLLTAGDILRTQTGKGMPHSVQNTVEIFAGAIVQAQYRTVGVLWNKFQFWGELYGASIKYTMFNRLGDPVRAVVTLQIRQSEPGSDALSLAVDSYWNNAYKQMLTSAGPGRADTLAQNLGNILNI